MRGRVLLLGRLPNGPGTLAALLVDGRLEDLLTVPDPAELAPGRVVGARVERRMPKQNAAIVGFGDGRTGYLRDAGGLVEGERVVVQVTTFAEAAKAVPVSRRVLYKGRTVIHTPGAPGINLSRRLKDWEGGAALQQTIKSMVAGLEEPHRELAGEGGFIIRHAARTVLAKTVEDEARSLLSNRLQIERQIADARGPMPAELRLAWDLALRELTDPMPDRVILDAAATEHFALAERDIEGFDGEVRDFAEPFGKGDPFDHFGVWDELARLSSAEVGLPSGGSMAVEATRAMVAVDVNTGDRFTGGAALTANLEAARELPRQLRLRGLGGQIAVDFAPVAKKDRRRVEDALKTSFRRDPVETSLAGWTPLGNFELSRKRERRPISDLAV